METQETGKIDCLQGEYLNDWETLYMLTLEMQFHENVKLISSVGSKKEGGYERKRKNTTLGSLNTQVFGGLRDLPT